MPEKEIYFQKRKYNKKEIAGILDIDINNSHFKRAVETKLQNLGFGEEDYQYIRGGDVIILWVPTEPEDKIEYLVRLLGIDKQVDVMAFSIFTYLMARELDIQGIPWQEKANFIKDNYDIDVSEKTLRNWTNKLQLLGELQKDKQEFNWWCSFKIDGETVRVPVETEQDREELAKYQAFIRGFYERGEKIDFSQVWAKFGCKYYRSYYFRFGAWNNTVVMDELLDMVEIYLKKKEFI